VRHEDDILLALSKPAGVDVGGLEDQGTPGLLELLPAIRPPGERLHVVNRLSRFESGILILAKDPSAAATLRAAWKSSRVHQEYVAVVLGRLPQPRIAIDASFGSSRGRSRTADRETRGRPRVKARPPVTTRSPASTTLHRLQQAETRSLIRCDTTVPTTHSLRAQLRSVGVRLLGDRLHDRSCRPAAHEVTCLHLAKAAFQHPRLRTTTTVTAPSPPAFAAALAGRRDVERALTAALVRRLPRLVDSGTDAYRLLIGAAEDLPGLVADRYGSVIVLQILEDREQLRTALPRIAAWYGQTLGVRAVYLKHFAKDRVRVDEAVSQSHLLPTPFWGEPVPAEIDVVENGLRFIVRPYDGFAVGLFLDHRENRRRVRELSPGKDVLNLFAYTCGFSVAAAVGGANTTVSVDLSAKHLEWGRANLDRNGVNPANHQFIRSDAMGYVKRAKRQGKQFDVIVIDPPSFAHGRRSKQTFSVMTDLAALVAGAGELLRPGGGMMISTNHRQMSRRGLRDRIADGLRQRRHVTLSTPPLPIDFAMDPDHAKTVFVQIGEGPESVAST
jgi:23S rRNA (cytosine1962-C5)-methyltransferase